jgi:hypothetical protein
MRAVNATAVPGGTKEWRMLTMAWPYDYPYEDLSEEKKKDLLAMMDILIRQMMNIDDHLVQLLIVLSPVADEILKERARDEAMRERGLEHVN